MLEIKSRHLTWVVPKCLICKGTFAIIARLPKYDFFLRIKSLPQAISHLFLKWFRGKENDQPLSSAILSSMARKKLRRIFSFPFLMVFLHVFFLISDFLVQYFPHHSINRTCWIETLVTPWQKPWQIRCENRLLAGGPKKVGGWVARLLVYIVCVKKKLYLPQM